MATIASLLVTSKPLEPSRLSWITAGFRRIPLFMSSSAKAINQFSTGDANFNYLGILLTVTPAAIVIIGFLNTRVAGEDLGTKRTLQSTSIYFGIGAVASMGFFLIPVARHSVILAAMGWNPIHAMRIHIISGYAFFWFSIIHGITYVPVWFMDKNDGVYPSVRDQVVPGRVCWVGDQNYKTFFTVNDGKCRYQFFGLFYRNCGRRYSPFLYCYKPAICASVLLPFLLLVPHLGRDCSYLRHHLALVGGSYIYDPQYCHLPFHHVSNSSQ